MACSKFDRQHYDSSAGRQFWKASYQTMSTLSDGKGLVDLLTRAWDWLQGRLDPVRAQAHRTIWAFEAHGVARQQIPRILPPSVAIPSTAFSSPDRLKDRITPTLLDWAADYLALNRRWLDGLDVHPHRRVEGYKDEEIYAEWLHQRRENSPDCHRMLFVCTAKDPVTDSTRDSPICLIYVEESAWLDDGSLRRYWLLSDHWRINHGPCVSSMLEVVRIGRSLNVLVIGRLVQASILTKLEDGRILAPQAMERMGKLWYPEDMAAATSANATKSRP